MQKGLNEAYIETFIPFVDNDDDNDDDGGKKNKRKKIALPKYTQSYMKES